MQHRGHTHGLTHFSQSGSGQLSRLRRQKPGASACGRGTTRDKDKDIVGYQFLYHSGMHVTGTHTRTVTPDNRSDSPDTAVDDVIVQRSI